MSSKRTLVMVLAVMALPLIWGCSKPPELEMQKANTSIQAAMTAEAEEYAPQSLTVARDTLNSAMAMKEEQDGKFALFRSYGKAKAQFVRAEALAQKAATDAAAEKERVRQEVADLLTQTRAALDAAKTALDAAPVGKGNRADIELIKNDLVTINTAFDEARAEFDGGKFKSAKAKVEAVMARATSITAEIANAAAKKAGRK